MNVHGLEKGCIQARAGDKEFYNLNEPSKLVNLDMLSVNPHRIPPFLNLKVKGLSGGELEVTLRGYLAK